jgi:[acyl-carrier-protein] S-malonyltransferase
MKGFIEASTIVDAKLPIVANVTADYETSASEIKANLAIQVDHSVLWEQSIKRLLDDGFDTFVEVGAGAVLSGLIKRMSKDVSIYNTRDSDAMEATIASLKAPVFFAQ